MKTHYWCASRRQCILFLLVGIFSVLLYVVLNYWVYKDAMLGNPILPKHVQQWLSKGVLSANGSSLPQEAPIPSRIPSLAPTPTPLQGPGTYACDPFGTCNLYDNPVGKGCPKTFADSLCLGRCGNKSNRCPK